MIGNDISIAFCGSLGYTKTGQRAKLAYESEVGGSGILPEVFRKSLGFTNFVDVERGNPSKQGHIFNAAFAIISRLPKAQETFRKYKRRDNT